MDILEILIDSLLDCLKMLPFIFLTYILIEVVERRADFAKHGKFLEGGFAPAAGALAGVFPQCGVSVMSAKLFDNGLIGVGTLLSVFIATSDEALSILVSGEKRLAAIPLIIFKIILAIAVGMIANAFLRRRIKYKGEESRRAGEEDFDHEEVCAHCHDHVRSEGKYAWVNKYILVPLIHSLQTFLYIFAVAFVFGIFFGEEGLFGDKLESFLAATKYFAPFIAALVGLIPNCASSAVITSAYVSGGISFGAMFAGLVANAGVGLAVLFKKPSNLKRNLLITLALYLTGAVAGLILAITGMPFGL